MEKRVYWLMTIFASLLILVLGRLAFLQFWDGPNSGPALVQRALKFRSLSIPGEEFYRGEILDRNYLSLTDSGIRPALVAFPSSMANSKETAMILEKIIDLSTEQILLQLKKGQEAQGPRVPQVLQPNLTAEEVDRFQ
jgi:cell division protein FtsI/penicillin-binding protein 2